MSSSHLEGNEYSTLLKPTYDYDDDDDDYRHRTPLLSDRYVRSHLPLTSTSQSLLRPSYSQV
jgi:hypothetical protein